ncbi:methyl-accepting chemotaxis protein, partial [Vibrio harveyi]
LLLLFWAMP